MLLNIFLTYIVNYIIIIPHHNYFTSISFYLSGPLLY